MILKKAVLSIIALILFFSSAVNAKSFDNLTESQIAAIQEVIKLSGYKCDTVDSVMSFISSSGATIACNNYIYRYDIENKNGKIVITVK